MIAWVGVFVGAGLVAALVALVLRGRIAPATDDDALRASSGTLALLAGFLGATALGRGLSPRDGLLVGLAAAVGVVSILAAHRILPRRAPSCALIAASAVAVTTGLRFEVTRIDILDVGLTLVWIGAVVCAVRRLDPRDGSSPPRSGGRRATRGDALATGITSTVTGAVFVVAAHHGQEGLATVVAALAGACMGIACLRGRFAGTWLDDPASQFVGFALANLVLQLRPPLPETGAVLALLLLGLPMLDLTAASVAGLRRRQPLGTRAAGQLVARLQARGLTRQAALGALLGAQTLLAALAVLAGVGMIAVSAAALSGALVLATVAAVALTVRIDGSAVVAVPSGVRLAILTALCVPFLLGVPAIMALDDARGPAEDGVRAVRSGLEAAARGDDRAARSHLVSAQGSLDRAHERLAGPLPSLGLALPVLSSNLRAARTLVDVAGELARSVARVTTAVDLGRLRVVGGRAPLPAVRAIAPDLARAAATTQRAERRLQGVDRPYLVPAIRTSLNRIAARVRTAVAATGTAAEAARLAPALLGGHGQRRYLLLVQNNAESRATGGYIGNYGVLGLDDGALRLERFGQPTALHRRVDASRPLRAPSDYVRRYGRLVAANPWAYANMSPDFPTVAAVMADLYLRSDGRPVGGVIAVDPVGLSALLELTGPVRVRGWPDPIAAGNVVQITLSDAYAAYPDRPGRVDFLARVTQRVIEVLHSADLGEPRRMGRVLGQAARRGHLRLYSAHPDEQRLFERLSIAGRVARPRSDALRLVTQSYSPGKMDYYLRRRLRYAVRLTPHDTSAELAARLQLTLRNEAPARGLVASVIGPTPGFAAGENVTLLSVYGTASLRASRLDRQPLRLRADRELGHRVHFGAVSLPPRSTRTLTLDLAGTVPLERGGWYVLQLGRQPLIEDDDVTVTVDVAQGWRIVEAVGMTAAGRHARARLRLDADRILRLRLERSE